MKKIVFILYFLLTVMFCVNSESQNISSTIKDVRSSLSQKLNIVISELQAELKLTQEKLFNERNVMVDSYKKAKALSLRSNNIEVNPTILSFASHKMPKCVSYQDLYWTGGEWACKLVQASPNCYANVYETANIVTSGDVSGFICSLEGGEFKWQDTGLWGRCENGVMKTQKICTYTTEKKNPITGEKLVYEVADSFCINAKPIQVYSTPCGPNNECSCPTGTSIVLKNNKRYCASSLTCPAGSSYVGGYCQSGRVATPINSSSTGGRECFTQHNQRPCHAFEVKVGNCCIAKAVLTFSVPSNASQVDFSVVCNLYGAGGSVAITSSAGDYGVFSCVNRRASGTLFNPVGSSLRLSALGYLTHASVSYTQKVPAVCPAGTTPTASGTQCIVGPTPVCH